MIKVIFSTTGGIGSRLLRVMMASPYSHFDILPHLRASRLRRGIPITG